MLRELPQTITSTLRELNNKLMGAINMVNKPRHDVNLTQIISSIMTGVPVQITWSNGELTEAGYQQRAWCEAILREMKKTELDIVERETPWGKIEVTRDQVDEVWNKVNRWKCDACGLYRANNMIEVQSHTESGTTWSFKNCIDSTNCHNIIHHQLWKIAS